MSLRPSVDWLLVFIPVVATLDRAGAAAPMVFLVAALAIVPLAALIVRSTERVAEHIGPAAGGLLNATFGPVTAGKRDAVTPWTGLADQLLGLGGLDGGVAGAGPGEVGW